MTPSPDGRIAMLRHTVATLAYRGGKALRGAPAEFAAYGSRTPGEILAHVCDLFDWALTIADGKEAWHNSQPGAWEADTARFFAGLEAFRWPSGQRSPTVCRARAAVSGPGGGCADARGTNRHAAADGGLRDERRELFRGGD